MVIIDEIFSLFLKNINSCKCLNSFILLFYTKWLQFFTVFIRKVTYLRFDFKSNSYHRYSVFEELLNNSSFSIEYLTYFQIIDIHSKLKYNNTENQIYRNFLINAKCKFFRINTKWTKHNYQILFRYHFINICDCSDWFVSRCSGLGTSVASWNSSLSEDIGMIESIIQ